MQNRRAFIGTAMAAVAATHGLAQTAGGGKKYVRFEHNGRGSYGVVEGDSIAVLTAAPWNGGRTTGAKAKLSGARLLPPAEPSKVVAVGLNYKSHIGSRPAPKNPEMFYKPPSCLLEPGGKIVIPQGTNDCHYEGELVVVIGKRASRVSVADAPAHVFGVTCGNDVSARDWQKGDLQWWRAKGSDTFGPLGPWIATGLDYGKVQLQTRLNGQVKQSQTTADLLFDVPTVVSFISHYVTLLPGDVIYTGTPGQTSAMKPGDVVEVEIEGIGVLKNTVSA